MAKTIATAEERRAGKIRTRARTMANSGEHGGWPTIKQMLRSQPGYPEVLSVLDAEHVRHELDQICLRARARKAEKPNA